MFEARKEKKEQLLREKLYLLMAEQSNSIRNGNFEKANQISNQINETLRKINALSEKRFDKTGNNLDQVFFKNNNDFLNNGYLGEPKRGRSK